MEGTTKTYPHPVIVDIVRAEPAAFQLHFATSKFEQLRLDQRNLKLEAPEDKEGNLDETCSGKNIERRRGRSVHTGNGR